MALEWTPTTTHVGLYLALARGWYAEHGLSVTLASSGRGEDDCVLAPAGDVARGDADVGVGPTEGLVRQVAHPERTDLVAVAAVAQRDTSAVGVLADSGVGRPRDLDGCTYAAFATRFEPPAVTELIRADGGTGDLDVVRPDAMDVPGVLLTGTADATWVFPYWEGLLAERGGVPLRSFPFREYAVPHGYGPVLFVRRDTDVSPDELESFLAAVARGYRAAAADPVAAANDLGRVAQGPHLDDRQFLRESARRFVPNLLDDEGRWGRMDRDRWEAYVRWLRGAGVLDTLEEPLDPTTLDLATLYTNDYLPG